MRRALHFVGFSHGDRYYRALRVFGVPDFIHRFLDRRAVAEIVPGDTVVYAKGDGTETPRSQAYDDSAFF